MTRTSIVCVVAIAIHAALAPPVAVGERQEPTSQERRVKAGKASLYTREVGHGQPILVLHGGPDFDHSYFVPELDSLSDAYRLIYYDQRGRGKSADGVQPDDVTIASEVSDLEKIRESFQLESAAVLGHSWGAVLALEYATRHPDRVSHIVLMNPAPVSAADFAMFRQVYVDKLGNDLARLKAVAATPSYKDGDPDAVEAYYRIHFQPALTQPEHLETIVKRLRASFTRDGILKARAIEDRLVAETWRSPGYDLLPKLATLRIPALVLYSEHDFIPPQVAEHIARALPNARLVGLKGCGHFSYLDCPSAVRTEIDSVFRR
ncbi:MAG TPA: alpha/beta hydrolase [Vicinamibacterales bacterium]|nr:alpha/beta hydrolase [Vicinamibacterales bacterium]